MKVVSNATMIEIEKRAIDAGISAEELMCQAAEGIAHFIGDTIENNEIEKVVTLIAGKGNNAGDGYCTALILLEMGYQVNAYQLAPLSECSPLCKKYATEFKKAGGNLCVVKDLDDFELPFEGVILDGILGTGFKGKLSSLYQEVITAVNQAIVPIFAIDIPSGLNGDTGDVESVAIQADHTLFLGFPKTGFFISEGWNYVGRLVPIDIGIDLVNAQNIHSPFTMLSPMEVGTLIPKMERKRHKYQAGYVAGFSGSGGMMGASILSGMGALKGGAGIVKLIHFNHECVDSFNYPELIHKSFKAGEFHVLLEYVERAQAIYIGPGLGMLDETQHFVLRVLKEVKKPMVIDADALNILAMHKINPPKHAILTPHFKEAARLLHLKEPSMKELMLACQQYVNQHEVVLVLKGGPTFIFSPKHIPFVCPVGDPGMATAGSGDVLTGVIAAILTQMPTQPIESAALGVFLHGLAGECAADLKTSYSMIASDIIKSLHRAWALLLPFSK